MIINAPSQKNTKMNILFLLRLWPVYGGGETVTITLANEMVKRGWNVSVLYFKDNLAKDLPFVDERINIIRLKNVNCDEFYADIKDSKKVSAFISKIIAEKNIDAVINQWYPVEYIKDIRKGHAKVITCLHQAFYTPIMDLNGAKAFLKKIFKKVYIARKKKQSVTNVMKFLPYVDSYVFLSPRFKEQFISMSGYIDKDKKLRSISNPLSITITDENIYNNRKKKEVLLVGRMVESQKRVSKALRIWKVIEQEYDINDWSFKIVGDGPDLKMYKKMAQDFNLSNISFEGFQDPKPYYKDAKIFFMTSAFEGFGMTLIEASQYGAVPIVMDSFLSLHDIIVDGYNGRIVPNNDIALFAKKTIELMQNDDLRNGLAQNTIQSIDKFRVDNIVNQWEQLIFGEKNED